MDFAVQSGTSCSSVPLRLDAAACGSALVRRVPHLLVLACVLLAGCTLPLPGESPTYRPPPAPHAASGEPLRVHFVDVGQGDGVIWELPGGGLVVYDCGDVVSADEENAMVRYLRDVLRVAPGGEIQALVASHGHRDHIGGCDEVLREFRFLHVYEAWYDGEDRPRSYRIFQDELREEHAILHVLAETGSLAGESVFGAGDAVELPAGAAAAGVDARFFWPRAPPDGPWDAIAESSLGVRLAYGDTAYCFQGDIETAQENALAMRPELQCDVYLVGHHGSRYASAATWLATMQPKVAVASFGPNSYGHPASEALCRIQRADAQVYATHRLGDIVVETDGANLTVTPDRPETQDYCAADASYWE